jgi:hypothetical protein
MTFTLKNNTTTRDMRLDRIQEFDPKSRSFPIRSLHTAKQPRSYTWRCNEWFDQGREGACVAYSLGHELASRPAEVTGITDKWLVEDIYWNAQRTDPWQGGAYPNATPRYDGTSVLAGVKQLHKQQLFKSYRWAFGIDDLILGIGHNGPAVLGINWYEGMFNTTAKGYITPTGYIAGGHAILARAVNVKEQRITLRNSWGKGWGVNGDCYISFADMDTLLKQNGEAVFMLERTAKFHAATF